MTGPSYMVRLGEVPQVPTFWRGGGPDHPHLAGHQSLGGWMRVDGGLSPGFSFVALYWGNTSPSSSLLYLHLIFLLFFVLQVARPPGRQEPGKAAFGSSGARQCLTFGKPSTGSPRECTAGRNPRGLDVGGGALCRGIQTAGGGLWWLLLCYTCVLPSFSESINFFSKI
jgi:hypothetical protein